MSLLHGTAQGPASRKLPEPLAGWALFCCPCWWCFGSACTALPLNYGFGSHSVTTLACESSLSWNKITATYLQGPPPGLIVSILPG